METASSPPATTTDASPRDAIVRLVAAAFPNASCDLTSLFPKECVIDGDVRQHLQSLVKATKTPEQLEDEQRNADGRTTEQRTMATDLTNLNTLASESVKANADLITVCQQLVNRLRSTDALNNTSSSCSWFTADSANDSDASAVKISSPPSTPTTTAAAAAYGDYNIDFDLCVDLSSPSCSAPPPVTTTTTTTMDAADGSREKDTAIKNKTSRSTGAGDDVIHHLQRRVAQLGQERDDLVDCCQVLTLHLRNARSALEGTTKKMEQHCIKVCEEVARAQTTMRESNLAAAVTTPAARNVAAVSTTTTTPSALAESDSPQSLVQSRQQHHDLSGLRSAADDEQQQGAGKRGHSPDAVGPAGRGSDHHHHHHHHHGEEVPSQQAEDDQQQQQQQQQQQGGAQQTSSASLLDPLERVYLQSYPSLGMGMILQAMAVVFKREYDIDAGAAAAAYHHHHDRHHHHHLHHGQSPVDTAAARRSPPDDATADMSLRSTSNRSPPQTLSPSLSIGGEEDDAASSSPPPLDEHAQFDGACRLFHSALQKEIGPMLSSFTKLQSQMGLLSGSSTSIRADYVSLCLQMRMKPNSGVSKALTALATTDRRRVRAIDFSNFLLGDHGVLPVATVLESLYRLERLDLRSNNLHANGIRSLCAMLRRHPSVVEVDLRGNPVGRAGAKMLLALAAEVPRIQRIVIDDRAVEDPLHERISKELARNRAS